MLLKNIQIENFRSFEHYKVENLAQVNLFVGDNNSGKTSVLEAMHALIANGNIQCVCETLQFRETIKAAPPRKDGTIVGHLDCVPLFRRHFETPLDELPRITISTNDDVQRSVSLYLETDADGMSSKLMSACEVDGFVVRNQFARTNADGTLAAKEQPAPELGPDPKKRAPKSPPHLFIGPTGVSSFSRTLKNWGTIVKNRLEKHVLQALQVLSADYQNIAFLPEAKSRADIFVDTSKDRLSLADLGFGVSHVLAIAIAMGACRSGIVFIDEIDTGLHYSHLADLWRSILKISRKLNVQVFATTHSLDCLRALAEVIDTDDTLIDDDIALFSIDRRVDYAVRFDREGVVIVVDHGIEVR